MCMCPNVVIPASLIAFAGQWCTVCSEFSGTLVLCAGCRVAVCCGTEDATTGCLYWSPAIRTLDFIYYCRFCQFQRKEGTPPMGSPIAERNQDWPSKWVVFFRYNPAVVVVSMNHSRQNVTFRKGLQHLLALHYTDHEDLVCYPPIYMRHADNR